MGDRSAPEPEFPNPAEAAPQSPPPPQPDAALPRRPGRAPRTRRLVFAALFLLLGTGLGSSVRLFLNPPPPPARDSVAEAHATAHIRALAAQLPIVQSLTADPAWESWEAYGDLPHSNSRLTTGPLSGPAGLGAYQHIFHNPATGAYVSVVFLGSSLSGWPGVVHGGALATLLDESCGRVAIRQFPGHTGVTARLELRYRAPVGAAAFCVVRAVPVPEAELPESERGKRDRKMLVRATVEDLEGRLCVEAEGLFVVPKGMKLGSLSERF